MADVNRLVKSIKRLSCLLSHRSRTGEADINRFVKSIKRLSCLVCLSTLPDCYL